MHTLVTGAAGYIGSHTAKLLLQHGHTVTAIDSLELGHAAAVERIHRAAAETGLRPDNLAFHQLATHDEDQLTELIARARPDTVLHFAAYASVPQSIAHPLAYHHNNTAGTIALLRAIHNARLDAPDNPPATSFVFSSTCAVYGDVAEEHLPIAESLPPNPTHPYGSSKLAAEHAVADYAHAEHLAARPFHAAALRYFNVAGADDDPDITRALGEDHAPESHIIPLAVAAALGRRETFSIFGTDYPTPDGTAIRDYIHVLDLAAAHITTAHFLARPDTSGEPHPAPFNTFNLGSGRGYSVREVVAAVEDVAREQLGPSATPYINLTDAPRRPGDPPRLLADTTRYESTFRVRPAPRDLREQAASALRWFRAHPDGFATR